MANNNSSPNEREILIKFNKKTNNIDNETYDLPISVFAPGAALRDIVIEKLEIPSEKLTLEHKGVVLDESKNVFELGLKNKDVVDVIIRDEEFNEELAKETIRELAMILCEVAEKTSELQIALNENDIDGANQAFQNYSNYFNEQAPKLTEKMELLPKPY